MGGGPNKLANSLHNNAALWIVDGCPASSRVLIAMDGSDFSMRALEYTGKVFYRTNAEFLLFHSVGVGSNGLVESLHQYKLETSNEGKTEGNEKNMQSVFCKSIRQLEQIGVKNSKIIVKIDKNKHSPAEAVVEVARQEGCGTIVLGRKGRSNNQLYYLGKISNDILQLAKELSIIIVS
jgi:nucleotide-binding universal stress UspA family protein